MKLLMCSVIYKLTMRERSIEQNNSFNNSNANIVRIANIHGSEMFL